MVVGYSVIIYKAVYAVCFTTSYVNTHGYLIDALVTAQNRCAKLSHQTMHADPISKGRIAPSQGSGHTTGARR